MSTPSSPAPPERTSARDYTAPVRRVVPPLVSLGLSGKHAREDLEFLGWDNGQSLDLLWALSACAQPNAALLGLVRFKSALDSAAGTGRKWEGIVQLMRDDVPFRLRVISVFAGSNFLADFLIAHPHLWEVLARPLPARDEMFEGMLTAVEAHPIGSPDPEKMSYGPGTYRARIDLAQANKTLKDTYLALLLRVAAYDLAGTFPETKRHPGGNSVGYARVTGLLSDLADAALTAALAVAVSRVYPDENAPAPSLSVVALGKSGAHELNYISDVDVIFVSEEVSPQITRLAGEFAHIGTQAFFEIDANLRPEGRSGALVRTLESHLAYYKRWAETWEFQALLKARPMTGDMELGARYCATLEPLVWAASQRDSFVEDVQSMRNRVVQHVPAAHKNRELKLGRGGLRDVEFAVQLLQMVHGRADASLRVPSTVGALDALIAGGYVGRDDGHALVDAYSFLRLLEHRLQLQRLRRTHLLPEEEDEEKWAWLAAVSGFVAEGSRTAVDALHITLRRVRLQVSELHTRLFYRPLLNSVVAMSVDTLKLSGEAARLQLGALGYRHPDRAFQHLSALASGSSRKARIQAMLLPTLMEWLAHTADPDAGLLHYRQLSDAAYDNSWFLRLLRDEGVVGQRLMHILGTSPYISQLIISAPDFVQQLGDGSAGPRLLATSAETTKNTLLAVAGRHEDPARAISVARALRRTELARIASADLLGMMPVAQVCSELSLVWCAVLEAALTAELRAATQKLATEDNPAPQPLARIAIIGMGRLGGMELGYGSDADVMVVAEPTAGVENHEALEWAAQIIDRVRKNLSKPGPDPTLEVDLGLRPEGRSGATVRTVESYRRYYAQWGEVWEIQALLRAAPIAGDGEVGQRFIDMINAFRYPAEARDASVITAVRRMKARVDSERLPRGADKATHTKLGRGALTDIEWTVQLLIMLHSHAYPDLHTPSTLQALEVIAQHELIDPNEVEVLREAWLTATRDRNALVLVRGKRTDQLPPPGPQLAQTAGAAGWKPHDYQRFLDNYLRATRKARRVVDRVFWGEEDA